MPEYRTFIPIMTSNNQNGFSASATSYLSGHEAYRAFDGMKEGSTFYRSSTNPSLPEYLTIIFPEPKLIGRYTIYLGISHSQYINMRTWDFEGLINGNWILLHSGENLIAQPATLTFDFKPIEVTGVRIKCKSRHGNNSWGIDELEVFEYYTYYKILLLTGNNKYYSFKREEDSIPNMTSNTEPKGRVTASHGEDTAFNAFNDNTSSWLPGVEQNAWIQYEFPKLDNITITNLYLTSERMNRKGGSISYESGIQDFEVYISTNGIDFKKIYENTHPNDTGLNPYKYEINYKGVIKYIRILVKSAYPHTTGRDIGVRRIRVEYIANQMVELSDDNMSDIIINYGILPQELSEIDLSVFVGKYCINNQFTLLGSGRLFEYTIGKSNIKKITIK